FIEGIVEHKSSGELVINAGGVGYLLLCSQSTLSAAPPRGEFTRIYTHLSVREDAMELFGFTSQEEKAMFLRLTSISGIGPRTALGVLAAMPLPDLTLAILTGDAATLCRAPGIGKKTAQRITLELKDKLSAEDLPAGTQAVSLPGSSGADSAVGEAILALQSLGYTQSEAARAVSAAHQDAGDGAGSDDLVRLALRGMMKG
ncbi:MAG: Holliday junction branch migration protein RuvA, partial [Clostridiales bacterium]|nr:Holliday junction branch migration protein RuvA [Clostridiales bacterium]